MLGITPANDPKQALRIKRFLMAVLVYLIAMGLMAVYVLLGFMGPLAWLSTSAAIVLVNLVFFVVLRSGWNERLDDPSLTVLQMFAACLFLTLTMYQLEQARGALLLLFVVLLMFGMFRLRTWQFMSLGILAVFGYAAAILGVYRHRPTDVELPVALLQLVALAVLVPCGSFFAGYVERLRHQLRERHVELQRARETIHGLTVQDTLTGVSNRNAIVEFLQQESERAARLDLPLAVLALDVDRFKEVNRNHGPMKADRVLRHMAEALAGALRTIDGLGRYGGEEFLVVLPDTPEDRAVETADRLRKLIADLRLPEDSTARLSVSVGVAQFDGDENSWVFIDRALQAADRALRAGGNRVARWEPGGSLDADTSSA